MANDSLRRQVAAVIYAVAAVAVFAAPAASQTDEADIEAVIEAVFMASERADYAALDTLYAGEDLHRPGVDGVPGPPPDSRARGVQEL
jgi:hypothetical protein